MTLDDIRLGAAKRHLMVMGAFHTEPDDDLPGQTVVLLGPGGPRFWPHVQASAEFQDGAPDPLDRWSRRVIGTWACDLGGKALFPFGAPVRPFYTYALRSGLAQPSPVTWLLHRDQGLLASYRGALCLKDRLELDPPMGDPCTPCAKPCATACPVGALTPEGYDVPACKAHVASDAGRACRETGCLVRTSCPIIKAYPRDPAQSAYHMEVFLG